MPPPNGVQPRGSQDLPPPNPADEIQDHLNESTLVGDPQWSESDFRSQHLKLNLALEALRRYMRGDEKMTEEKLKKSLDAWTQSPEFSAPENKEFNEKALKSIHRQLGTLRSAELVTKAGKVKEFLPPAPEEPKPVPAPVIDKKPPAKSPEKETKKPRGWRLNALTFDFHAADDEFRSAPHYYTIKVLPKNGITQNQDSNFAGAVGAEFGVGGFDFYSGLYYGDFTPMLIGPSVEPGPAQFRRAGVRFGLVEYGGFGAGKRGPGGKGHITLLGRSRTGFELGSAWCSKIEGSEVSGAECPKASAQLGVTSETTFLTFGYGPFEAGVSLLNGSFYLDGNDTPGINRLPLEFNLAFYFDNPQKAEDPMMTEDGLRKGVTNAEVTNTALKLVANSFGNNYRRKQEFGFMLSRPQFFANEPQLKLLNTGGFVFPIFSGWNEGTLAHRLARDLHYGNWTQRGVLAGFMGAELLVHGIASLATPGMPDNIVVFPGTAAPEDKDLLSVNEGFSNLQNQAWRMNLEQVAFRDALALAGALGAFGDRNKAIKEGGLHLPIANGVLFVGGLAMILTSGDQSGEGFLGGTIAGNQAPKFTPGQRLELTETSYDPSSQRWQNRRLEWGTQLLGFASLNLVDYGVGMVKHQKKHPKEESRKVPERRIGFIVDPRLGGSVRPNGDFNLTLSARF